jgi:hypothetical protein
MFTLAPAFDAFLALEQDGVPYSLDGLLDRVDTRVRATLEQLAFAETTRDPETSTIQAVECIRKLEAKQLEAERNEMKRQIRTLEKEGNIDEVMRLTDELNKHQRASS